MARRAVWTCALALLAGGAVAVRADQPAGNAPASAAPNAPGGAIRRSDDTVVLNFVNADLEAVVRAVGQFTGRIFVIDPRVKGTLTLVTERPVTRQQAFEELLSALRLQGFTLVDSPEAGGVARILPEADAKLQGGRVVGPSAGAPHGDQVVTQVFRLQYESATNLVAVLRPLIAPNNTISAYAANNTLVITDYAENLRRLARIIEAIDSPATAEVEVVPLKYGLASDVAAILSKALDEGARTSGQAADSGQRVSVLAEPRTNMLILRAASRARLNQAKELIARFDQPSLTPGNINVVYLRNAQAVKLAPLLRAVLSSDPSFLQQASGSGLSVTPISSSLGQSSTNPQTSSTQTSQQPSAGGGTGYVGSSSGGGGSGGAVAGMIQADPATNSLIISAPEPLYRNIRSIIDRLDARPAQVMIESLVVELNGQQASEFGIQWQALNGLSNVSSSNSAQFIGGTNFGSGAANIVGLTQNITSPAPGLNLGIIKGQITIGGTTITNVGLLARALQTLGNTNILSRPNIQTLDNEEGKFLVGQNVGLLTGAYASTATTGTSTVNPFQTFERHDVGLQLAIKPQISEGGTVRLALYIEDSSVAAGSSADNPVLNKRSFQTNVLVEDGSFVVISGLIQDQADETQNKVPILGDIPLLGRLFRYDTRDRTKTQTMVFLRPTIIRDETQAADLAVNRYDYIRAEVAKSAQGNLPPLPNLSVEDLPPVPRPLQPKSQSVPVAPEAASRTPAPIPTTPNRDEAAARSNAIRYQLIQVSSVADVGRGHQLQQHLRQAGFDSYWESVRTANGDEVRIRIEVERRASKISEAISRLRSLGYKPVLVGP
ncbi:MAG TPA: type II secretion system secretin GspD [Burkholderiaceae bacterium]|nr:type II secretion system secretin GspD [Burkholderiaceae bacterium]